MVKSISQLKTDFLALEGKEITLQGWIRTNRSQKEFGFISLNDGSSVTNIQVVYEKDLQNFNKQDIKNLIDCDKISLNVTVRNRRDGDNIQLCGKSIITH